MAFSDVLNLVGGEVPLNNLRAALDLLAVAAGRVPHIPAGGDPGVEINAQITADMTAGGVLLVGLGALTVTGGPIAMNVGGLTLQGAANGFVAGSQGTFLRRTNSTASALIAVTASGTMVERMRMSGVATTPALITVSGGVQAVSIEKVRASAGGAESRFLDVAAVTSLNVVDIDTISIGATSVIQLTAEVHTTNPISQVNFQRCRIAGLAAADLIAAVGNVSAVKFVLMDFINGNTGFALRKPATWDATASGSRTNPTGFFFDLTTWVGQSGFCTYWEFGRRIMIGSAVSSGNTGDASGHVFRTDTADVNIGGSAHHRGFGRTGIYFDGTDLTMAGTRVANWGALSAAANARPISGIADAGGFVQLTIAVPSSRRQFDPWEWITIESATGGLNGQHKITAVSGTTVTLATAFSSGFGVTAATARPFTAGVHIGPNATDVDLNSVSIGRSDDSALSGQVCLLNESTNYVVWRPGGVDAGEFGITRWVPDTFSASAQAKILAQTGEHHERGEVNFTTFGAASNLFIGAPNGVYAVVGFAARIGSGTATIKAIRRTGTFVEHATTVVVSGTGWNRYMLADPYLVKVGDGTVTDIGVRLVSNTGTPGTLDVRPIVMRLAPM